ncbi:MAG: preprotein translocase subunit TatB [Burkholderiales bacterium]|nr:preprotein translocase subunit TatB [Burkholderiales bacterium]
MQKQFLAQFNTDTALSPITKLSVFFAALRPLQRDGQTQLPFVITALKEQPELVSTLRALLLDCFKQRHAVLLFATAGIYPATGVFAESWRRLSHKLLPEADEGTQLKDALRELLQPSDADWLVNSEAQDWQELIILLGLTTDFPEHAGTRTLLADILEALRVVAHRIAAAGLEPEMLRLDPSLENHASPFLGLCEEALALAQAFEHSAQTATRQTRLVVDIKHLEVLIAQARLTIERVRRRAGQQGASFHLTFRLRRLQQHLDRLERLAGFIHTFSARDDEACAAQLAILWQELAVAEATQNTLRPFWKQNAELVALRVTENAGRSGEHYITETRHDYFAMLKAAAGGGCAVALIAAIKINISMRGLAPLAEVLANCLNYGLGFVLIHLLHFSVATKQPAMTANAIAAVVGEMQTSTPTSANARDKAGKHKDVTPLLNLIARTVRTQLAAIIGNIGLAIPVAFLIAWLILSTTGSHFISASKAQHLLGDIDLLKLSTLVYAGVAGVCLFLAGLIAGYYDNLCSYSRIPERLYRLQWAQRLFGSSRWSSFTDYIRNNLGVLAGNFFLGFLLGGAAGLGTLLGVPLDVRHTTLSSAMWAYSLFALDFHLSWQVFVSTMLGFLAIGIVNLGVSFYLALAVALRARGVDLSQRLQIGKALGRHLIAYPRTFFLPPKKN